MSNLQILNYLHKMLVIAFVAVCITVVLHWNLVLSQNKYILVTISVVVYVSFK